MDSLDGMRKLPDRCIDIVITDPPYGLELPKSSKEYGKATEHSRKPTDDNWDDFIPDEEYFDEIFRVSKHQIIFGANYFWPYLRATPCYIVWDKRGNLPKVPFSDVELAWASFQDKMPARYVVINHGFIRDSKEERLHPTQKPLKLMVGMIEDFTEPGDIILDPFAGVGSTGMAAIQLGRKFLGFEASKKYCDIANDRLAAAKKGKSYKDFKIGQEVFNFDSE